MSETPRTDAVEWRSGKNLADCQFVVFSEFSRQLETELADKEKQLAEARAEIERLKEKLRVEITENLEHLGNIRWYEEMELPKKNKLIEQMREIINDYRIEHKAWCNHDPDNAKECTCGLSEKVKATLSAAERGE